MGIKERLRYHVARVGLNGVQIAEKVGKSPSAVSRWLNLDDPMAPSHESLASVVTALGMTMEEFWRPIPEAEQAAG